MPSASKESSALFPDEGVLAMDGSDEMAQTLVDEQALKIE